MCQKISIDGTAYNIKDATARENAQNATKNANSALENSRSAGQSAEDALKSAEAATNALNKATTTETNVNILAQESLVEYANETISFTSGITL